MLVLPTSTVPNQLKQYIQHNTKAASRTINAFQNKLTKSLQWVLKKNQDCCAQAFCFEVINDETRLLKLRSYENNECKIQVVHNAQNYYILIWKDSGELYDSKTFRISEEQADKLLQQIGHGENLDVARNILLNVFDSYENLQKSGLQSYLMRKTVRKSAPSTNETKDLVGKMLFEVPQYCMETGNYRNEQTIHLKIHKEQHST